MHTRTCTRTDTRTHSSTRMHTRTCTCTYTHTKAHTCAQAQTHTAHRIQQKSRCFFQKMEQTAQGKLNLYSLILAAHAQPLTLASGGPQAASWLEAPLQTISYLAQDPCPFPHGAVTRHPPRMRGLWEMCRSTAKEMRAGHLILLSSGSQAHQT